MIDKIGIRLDCSHPSPTSSDIMMIKPTIVVHEAKQPLPLKEKNKRN